MRCLAVMFCSVASVSFAIADPGDAEKAKEMLARVVVVVQQDEGAAMRKFSAGTDGFRDGNIYPFCFRLSDGVVMTGQTAGSDIRTFPGVGSARSLSREPSCAVMAMSRCGTIITKCPVSNSTLLEAITDYR